MPTQISKQHGSKLMISGEIKENPSAGLSDHLKSRFYHPSLPALTGENIVQTQPCMNPDQHRITPRDLPFHQSHVHFARIQCRLKCQSSPKAVTRAQGSFSHYPNKYFPLQPIADKLGDGDNLQGVPLSEAQKIRQPRHRPILIQDLADDSRRLQSCQPR
jgi:hypothetical protein